MVEKNFRSGNILVHLFFILASITFIVPLIYVISLSFTSEEAIREFGYGLIPKSIDFAAYENIFENPKKLIDAYKITILISAVGAVLGTIVMAMMGYAISRKAFQQRRMFTFFAYFTMLFSGGLIPSYIVNTRYLGLSNNILVYILPYLASAYYILILRTFFKTVPESLIESAKLDGAGEFGILSKIIVPLSKPALATILLFNLLNRWNDWNTSLLYIQDETKFTLQYLLQKILREDEFIKNMSDQMAGMAIDITKTRSAPIESMRFAMALLAAGPMLVVFPFFQKYFVRGLAIGAVKE